MAAELKELYGMDTKLVSGARGSFEVLVNGKSIFSKKKLARFPEEGEIAAMIDALR